MNVYLLLPQLYIRVIQSTYCDKTKVWSPSVLSNSSSDSEEGRYCALKGEDEATGSERRAERDLLVSMGSRRSHCTPTSRVLARVETVWIAVVCTDVP